MRFALPCGLMTLTLLMTPADAEQAWHRHYELGLEQIQAGQGAAAREALELALAAKGEPELRAATEGLRYVDYLPHLYLAVALHMAGDIDAAREHLRRSHAAGVARQSDVGRGLLEAYITLLGEDLATPTEVARDPEAAEQPPGDLPTYRDFEPGAPVLTESEAWEVEREVLRRCGLQSAASGPQLPWYFHWELGLELARRGDPQRALDALLVATERRGDSKRGARMYGMWFTDYLPYFQIARLHVELGNWRCAADALRRSLERGEVPPAAREYPELLELLDEVRAQTGLRE